MTKAIVTGGAGFIGSHIVDALVAQGSEVMVIDDLSTGRIENIKSLIDTKIVFHQADLCSAQAASLIEAYLPDVIFHFGAQVNVRRSVYEPVLDTTVNVAGTVNVAESARKSNCGRVVFASTGGAIYGEQEVFPADETHSVNPSSAYGVGKRAAETYLEYFSRISKVESVALRFANVYGPRQNPKGEAGVVAIFTERLFAGQELKVNGDGEQTRDFVFVGDVVRACLAAAQKPISGSFEAFNLGTGVETTVNQIVDALLEIKAQGEFDMPEIKITHGPALPGEQRRSVITHTKLATQLGVSPQVDLVDGLRLTLKSYIDNQ